MTHRPRRRGSIRIATAAVATIALAGSSTCRRSDEKTAFDDLKVLADGFVSAAAAARYDDAHGMLCFTVGAKLPLQRFRERIADNPFLQPGATFDAHTSRSVHGAAEIEGTIGAPAATVKAAFYASLLDERWCLTGALIGGTPMLPPHGSTLPPRARARPEADAIFDERK